MPRPNFITNDDICRWSNSIDSDQTLPKELVKSPIVREVCYAGFWLAEQLMDLKCPDPLIFRIQWTAGKLSFGRDAWDVHIQIMNDYKNNKLVFEKDDHEALN